MKILIFISILFFQSAHAQKATKDMDKEEIQAEKKKRLEKFYKPASTMIKEKIKKNVGDGYYYTAAYQVKMLVSTLVFDVKGTVYSLHSEETNSDCKREMNRFFDFLKKSIDWDLKNPNVDCRSAFNPTFNPASLREGSGMNAVLIEYNSRQYLLSLENLKKAPLCKAFTKRFLQLGRTAKCLK